MIRARVDPMGVRLAGCSVAHRDPLLEWTDHESSRIAARYRRPDDPVSSERALRPVGGRDWQGIRSTARSTRTGDDSDRRRDLLPARLGRGTSRVRFQRHAVARQRTVGRGTGRSWNLTWLGTVSSKLRTSFAAGDLRSLPTYGPLPLQATYIASITTADRRGSYAPANNVRARAITSSGSMVVMQRGRSQRRRVQGRQATSWRVTTSSGPTVPSARRP